MWWISRINAPYLLVRHRLVEGNLLMPWDEGLEGQARQIAFIDDSPIRVQAGPGSGKTFSLMRRVMRLLEDGADPSRILLVTFTRVSALDIEQELADLSHPEANQIRKGRIDLQALVQCPKPVSYTHLTLPTILLV